MERRNELVNIRVENLYPHPDNPRKDLGDITEITESVKKNGVMQNLTVIQIDALDEEPEKQVDANEISIVSNFIVLIGHRRLAAAKAAGLKEVPCKIVSKISKKEQVSIMLEENMQRSDLTIYEQAQGFQMMLDLGETAESIAQKTGFSQTTVYHRLNLAKLDQKVLQEKENDEGFQMSLKDLYELEQIEDPKLRNKILKEARNSRDLSWKASQAATEEKRSKNEKMVIDILEQMGIKKAPKKVEGERWSRNWETVKEIDLDKKVPKQIKLGKNKEDLLYVRWQYSNDICVIRKIDKKTQEENSYELKRKETERKIKAIKSIAQNVKKLRKQFIQDIISGKIPEIKEEEKIKEELWNAMTNNGVGLYSTTLYEFISGKNSWSISEDEKKIVKEQVDKLSMTQQMLIYLHISLNQASDNICDYFGKYNKEKGKTLRVAHEILSKYGWSLANEDEQKVMDGTHELYVKEEE